MWHIKKFCSPSMWPATSGCQKNTSTEKRTAKESIPKGQTGASANVEENENQKCEFHLKAVSERKRTELSARK